jgi:hypothetical protein
MRTFCECASDSQLWGIRDMSFVEATAVENEKALPLHRRKEENEMFAVFNFGRDKAHATIFPSPCGWRQILNSRDQRWAGAGSSYSRAPLMRFVAAHGIPLIRHFQVAAEVTLNAELRRAIEAESMNVDLVRALMEEAKAVHVNLDAATLEFALRRKLETMAGQWESQPCDLERVVSLESAVKLARSFPFEVRLWEIQNVYHSVLMNSANGNKPRGAGCELPEWDQSFRSLGEQLGMRMF